MKKIIIQILSLFIVMSFLYSCATIVKKYEIDKKQVPANSKISIMKNNKGEKWMELTSPLISSAVIKGSFTEDASGDTEFEINKLYFLVNWKNGWTEGEYEATGKLIFYKTSDGLKCKIIDNLEIGDIIKGNVRYFDDYYTGEKGTKIVKDRFDRIRATNIFLKTKGLPEFFGHAWMKTNFGDSFKNATMKILFPEFFGLNSKQLKDSTSDYTVKSPKDDIIISETIAWNKKYTDNEIPENLRTIRNSGTMFRDYEEALWLFLMDYNMKYYFEKILTK